jgi:(p)ppGpp synthase/HD superfamily hydrolase
MGRGGNNQQNIELQANGDSFRGEKQQQQVIDVLNIASEKNRAAMVWAETAHRNQTRKQTPNSLISGRDVPYFIHTATVMNILSKANADRNLVCAGILHDIVEDTDTTSQQLRKEFGNDVAELVAAVTKDDSFKGTRLEKQAKVIVAKCSAYGSRACALKAADLLANISDLVWTIEADGLQAVKDLFMEHRWKRKVNHYLELSELLQDQIKADYPGLQQALATRTSELNKLISQES